MKNIQRSTLTLMLSACVVGAPAVVAAQVVGWLGYPNDAGRTTGTKPTCGGVSGESRTYRSMTWTQEASSGSPDVYEVCLRATDGTYRWVALAHGDIGVTETVTVGPGGAGG